MNKTLNLLLNTAFAGKLLETEHRMEGCGPRTQEPRGRIEDQGSRTCLRTADQGHWMKASLGWPKTFIRWIMHIWRYMKVYEVLAEMAQWEEGSPLTSVPYVSLLLVLTFLGGFFSRYSGFPHFWKTNISKFQFELAFPLNIIVDKCLPLLWIYQIGYFNKFDDTLLWANWDEKFFDKS